MNPYNKCMKKVTETIVIDASKLTLDVFVRTINVYKQFINDTVYFQTKLYFI